MHFRLVELRLIDLLRSSLPCLHPMIQLIEMVARLGGKRTRSFHRRYNAKQILYADKYVWHVDIVYYGATPSQLLGCPFQRIDRFRKGLMPIQRSANSDTDIFEFSRRGCLPEPGNDRLQRGYVAEIACEEAHCVETGPQMPNPATVNSSKARLEAEYAAKGRR